LDELWRAEVLQRAARDLENELAAEGKDAWWALFRDHVLSDDGLGADELASRHGITRVDVSNWLARSRAHRAEAEVTALHTGRYCDARLAADRRRELSRILDACKAATKLGLEVAAGHGLNYQNVNPVAAIAEIEELNIGHAIVARAVLVGFERAVREMKDLLDRAR
jgi:hypothetical protein